MYRFFVCLLLLCASTVSVEAQQFKWGYVDDAAVIEGYKFYETALKQLETEYGREQNLLDSKAEEINRKDKDLRQKQDLTTENKDDARKKQEDELKNQTLEYMRRGREMSERLEKKKAFYMKQILESVDKSIIELGKKEGYQMIFRKKNLLYVEEKPEFNLTDKVIATVNAMPAPDLAKIDADFNALVQKEETRVGANTGDSLKEQAPKADSAQKLGELANPQKNDVPAAAQPVAPDPDAKSKKKKK